MTSEPEHDDIELIFGPLVVSASSEKHLYSFLSPDERMKAARFKFPNHRMSFIAARGLLRILLGSFIDARPEAIEFRYGRNGKPSIVGAPHVHFNVSHSGQVILYGLRLDHEIGVDIEHIRQIDDMDGIARQFFSPGEQREWLDVSEHDRLKAFFDCWTRKEAFIKFLGSGLSFPLRHFQVTLTPGHPARLVHVNGQSPGSCFLFDIAPHDNYSAAVASEGRNCRFRVWTLQKPEDGVRLFERCDVSGNRALRS